MAMTAAGMRTKVKALMALVGQPSDYGSFDEFRDAMFEAFCGGIIQEIVDNGHVSTTGSDPQGGVVNATGSIS